MFFNAMIKLLLSLVAMCFFAGVASAQEKKRGDYEFHLSKAYAYYHQKNYDLAMESVKGALRTKRNEPKIFLLKADINLALDRKPEAIRDLQKASRIGSDEADKKLIELGSKPLKSLNETEAKELENDLEKYLRKIEEEKLKKNNRENRVKKTKTR